MGIVILVKENNCLTKGIKNNPLWLARFRVTRVWTQARYWEVVLDLKDFETLILSKGLGECSHLQGFFLSKLLYFFFP